MFSDFRKDSARDLQSTHFNIVKFLVSDFKSTVRWEHFKGIYYLQIQLLNEIFNSLK